MTKAALLALALAALPSATQAQFLTRANNTPFALTQPVGCGSTPSEAAAAGLTTCALNFDFSLPSGAPSVWLDCADSDPTKPFHWGGIGLLGSSIGGVTRCQAAITQVTDPIDSSKKVLKLQWLPSYGVRYNNSVSALTWLDTSHYLDVPGNNFYIEIVARVDVSSLSSPVDTGGPNSIFMGANKFGTGPSPPPGIEWDPFELLTGNSVGVGDAAIQNWGGTFHSFVWKSPCGAPCPAGYSVAAYRKYGFRVTSDSSTSIIGCAYIDDVLQQCLNAGATSPEFLQREVMQLFASSQLGSSSNPQIIYFQYWRVWSCANWALAAGSTPTSASACFGTTLHNGPPPADTYWAQ